jgi:hypothetical protein
MQAGLSSAKHKSSGRELDDRWATAAPCGSRYSRDREQAIDLDAPEAEQGAKSRPGLALFQTATLSPSAAYAAASVRS